MRAVPKPKFYNSDDYDDIVKDTDAFTELLDGEIVALASPTPLHQDIIRRIAFAIDQYIRSNKGKCRVMQSPSDVKLDDYNVVVPDIFVTCKPELFTTLRYEGVPDFIIEVLSTNIRDDTVRKHSIYYNAGVKEYWIIDPRYGKVYVNLYENDYLSKVYDFNDDIPVSIYRDNLTPLKINVSKLISDLYPDRFTK